MGKKQITLGITGGVAAYKMIQVASDLTKSNFNVKVVMTKSAAEFVTPLTFEALTGNKVEMELFARDTEIKHIELARETDLLIIAPATANIIGKIAHGLADDLLTTLVLASRCPVLAAPAMNVYMYNKPVVQENIKQLKNLGVEIIEPDSGYLACGDQGTGRLPEPAVLHEYILKALTPASLSGKKILVSAGPTREPLDPVRFISNYSSGKMGYALARNAVYRGAEVTLVSGPIGLTPPAGVKFYAVETAVDMEETIDELAERQDIIIMAAAISDFRPEVREKKKIKKEDRTGLTLSLKSNPDILKKLGKQKGENQKLIGFALETEDAINNARGKLNNKNLDLIIANSVSALNSDLNQVTFISKNELEKLETMDKNELAGKILDRLSRL